MSDFKDRTMDNEEWRMYIIQYIFYIIQWKFCICYLQLVKIL